MCFSSCANTAIVSFAHSSFVGATDSQSMFLQPGSVCKFASQNLKFPCSKASCSHKGALEDMTPFLNSMVLISPTRAARNAAVSLGFFIKVEACPSIVIIQRLQGTFSLFVFKYLFHLIYFLCHLIDPPMSRKNFP